jgi:hypothetical protein
VTKPYEYLFVVYDKHGGVVRSFIEKKNAHDIAFDPRFKEKYTVRTYKLLKRGEEPKGVPVKCWREE